MDGLCFIAGCGPTIRLGNETVAVRALTLADYALIEAEILRLRGNPFDLLRRAAQHRAFREADAKELLKSLFLEVQRRWCGVSARDVRTWLRTWPGRIFALWLAIRENRSPSCTPERIQNLAATLDWRAITEAMQLASSEEERGALYLTLGTSEPDEPIPWSAIFRRLLSQPYQMTPDEISRLTMTQLQLLHSDADPGAQRLHFDSQAEFEEWRRRRSQATEQSVENLRHGLRWDSQGSSNHAT